MSLSTGDKVYVDCIGKWCGSEGTVIGRKDNGAYIVAFGESSPEPGRCEAFAEEHLIPSIKNLREVKVSEIKDSGERTEFETGAVRDMHEGKGDMLSMPWAALLRISGVRFSDRPRGHLLPTLRKPDRVGTGERMGWRKC